MIETKMSEIYKDFLENLNIEHCFCMLHDMNYANNHLPDYHQPLIQQHYLLRYFPAYLFEYKQIYSQILENNYIDLPFKVLSVGTGCGLDYYGLELALKDFNMSVVENVYYTGVDKVDWLYRDTLENDNCEFINLDITEENSLPRDDANIIIFPKSIGEFSHEGFQNVLECFRETSFTEERICIVSSMRDTYFQMDMARFQRIIELLTKQKNYRTIDSDVDYCQYYNDAITTIDQNFIYPDEIKEFLCTLHSKCNGYERNTFECDSACPPLINRSPILRAGHIKYQIVTLVKGRSCDDYKCK